MATFILEITQVSARAGTINLVYGSFLLALHYAALQIVMSSICYALCVDSIYPGDFQDPLP